MKMLVQKKTTKFFEGLFSILTVLAILPLSVPCLSEHGALFTFAHAVLDNPAISVESDHAACQSIASRAHHSPACTQTDYVSQVKFAAVDALKSTATALTAKIAVIAHVFTISTIPLPLSRHTNLDSTWLFLASSVTLQIHKRTVLLI